MSLRKQLERQVECIEASMRKARKDGKYSAVAKLAAVHLDTVKMLLEAMEAERRPQVLRKEA